MPVSVDKEGKAVSYKINREGPRSSLVHMSIMGTVE